MITQWIQLRASIALGFGNFALFEQIASGRSNQVANSYCNSLVFVVHLCRKLKESHQLMQKAKTVAKQKTRKKKHIKTEREIYTKCLEKRESNLFDWNTKLPFHRHFQKKVPFISIIVVIVNLININCIISNPLNFHVDLNELMTIITAMTPKN